MENYSNLDLTKEITSLEAAKLFIRGRDLLSIGLAADRSHACVRLTLHGQAYNPVVEKLIIEVAESKRKGMMRKRGDLLKAAEESPLI